MTPCTPSVSSPTVMVSAVRTTSRPSEPVGVIGRTHQRPDVEDSQNPATPVRHPGQPDRGAGHPGQLGQPTDFSDRRHADRVARSPEPQQHVAIGLSADAALRDVACEVETCRHTRLIGRVGSRVKPWVGTRRDLRTRPPTRLRPAPAIANEITSQPEPGNRMSPPGRGPNKGTATATNHPRPGSAEASRLPRPQTASSPSRQFATPR